MRIAQNSSGNKKPPANQRRKSPVAPSGAKTLAKQSRKSTANLLNQVQTRQNTDMGSSSQSKIKMTQTTTSDIGSKEYFANLKRQQEITVSNFKS